MADCLPGWSHQFPLQKPQRCS